MTVRPVVGATIAIVLAGPLAAQPAGDMTTLNTPGVVWTIYGDADRKPIRDASVQGGHAIQVTVKSKAANAWDVGGSSPIDKPIKKGDRIVLAFYAQSPSAAAGKTISIPALVQTTKDFKPVIQGSVDVGPQWKLVSIHGAAADDYPAGATQVTTHLAGDKQVIDLGPVFVMDLGPAKGG